MVRHAFSIEPALAIGFLVFCLWGAHTAAADSFLESSMGNSEAKSELNLQNESTPHAGGQPENQVARLSHAQERLDKAELYEVTALKSLRKARKRNYPRGPALEELRQNAARSQVERDAAEENFLRLVEGARRDGLPTRFLSSFLDRAEQIESLRAARAASFPARPGPN